jgi:ABC-2 type transport system permease protein
VRPLRQYVQLVGMSLLMNRAEIWFVAMIQGVLAVSFVLGFSYLIPQITDQQALVLTTGAATYNIVTVALVSLPQLLGQHKADGRLEYFLSLPVPREAYLLAQVTYVALLALPGWAFTLAFGAWHYDLTLSLHPLVMVVVPLAILSLAGVGIAVALLSPHQQLTNALSQLVVFYVLLFAPVLMSREQLPAVLRHAAVAVPPTYAADAMRATLTDLPGTHLGTSLLVMAGFAVFSLALSAVAVRRRG